MTVEQLVEILHTLPQDAEVVFGGDSINVNHAEYAEETGEVCLSN